MPVARTPHLDVAYDERNPNAREVVVLVHGFPDDATTWDALLETAPFAGARTIAPWLRGYGATRFRDAATPREAHASVLARDIVDLLDALGIERCTLVGHDWGARAAYGAAVLAPERIETLVAIAVGYGTALAAEPMSSAQARAYWYQWLFATPRGEAILRDRAEAFCEELWRMWSPTWRFARDEYARTSAAFANPDFVSIVLHSYRHRWGFASADLRAAGAAADDRRLAELPRIAVPTLVFHGDEDGATLPDATADRDGSFAAAYERVAIAGAGHFVQREAPLAVAEAYAAFRERVRA